MNQAQVDEVITSLAPVDADVAGLGWRPLAKEIPPALLGKLIGVRPAPPPDAQCSPSANWTAYPADVAPDCPAAVRDRVEDSAIRSG